MKTEDLRRTAAAPLPDPRGPLSEAVLAALRSGASPDPGAGNLAEETEDPYGDDLQLALHVLYELHYRGFDGVRDEREWDPDLLRVRAMLEGRFLAALRRDVAVPGTLDEALAPLIADGAKADADDLSRRLQRSGTLAQLREYAAVRSLYHLKEADPHAWVVPRLSGRAKAAIVAVEYDEFGAGRAEEVHARLFADLMDDLGLNSTYGYYLSVTPAPMLALTNLMSLLGLHRALRGALVGHFAAVEVTSSPASRRLAQALRRVGAGPAAVRFYAEHVEADAVHEQVVREDVIGGLLDGEPELAADVVFGIAATCFLEGRLAEHFTRIWDGGGEVIRLAGSATARGGREEEAPRRGGGVGSADD